MPIRQLLSDDIKAAMIAGDSLRLETLRGLKTAIQYVDVAMKPRTAEGIADADILTLFAREAKKRQESADLYTRGGSPERAEKELAEKAIIESYLPEQISEAALTEIVDAVIAELGAEGQQVMGKVIGAVKAKVGTAADGALVARLVRERLAS